MQGLFGIVVHGVIVVNVLGALVLVAGMVCFRNYNPFDVLD